MKKLLLVVLLALGLNGCGSGDDNPDTFAGEYDGVWDVRYNFDVDECNMTESGIAGFVDVHEIDQTAAAVVLNSNVGFGFPFNATLQGDNSFQATQSLRGDVFDDGIFCEVDQTISYQPESDNSARSLFKRNLVCDDGFICESRAVGISRRR